MSRSLITKESLNIKYEEIIDKEHIGYAYGALIDDLYYKIIENKKTETKLAKETERRIEAEKLLDEVKRENEGLPVAELIENHQSKYSNKDKKSYLGHTHISHSTDWVREYNLKRKNKDMK